jgi:two-component system nitrate/nitrite response regulator NarL
MEKEGNRLRLIGANHLFSEILACALSLHGWHVLCSRHLQSSHSANSEILLVASPTEPEEIIQTIRRTRADFPFGKIVLLGVDAMDRDIIRFIREGACAFIPNSKGIMELVHTLEMVRDNQTSCSGWITESVISTIHQLSQKHHRSTEIPLTAREQEILELIRDGLSNKEIATQLNIAPSTVKNHVHNLLQKLKVRSRHSAAYTQRRPPRRLPFVPGVRNGTHG